MPYIIPCSEPPVAPGELLFPLTPNAAPAPRVPCGAARAGRSRRAAAAQRQPRKLCAAGARQRPRQRRGTGGARQSPEPPPRRCEGRGRWQSCTGRLFPPAGDERAAASRGRGAAAGTAQRGAGATYPWCRRGLLRLLLLLLPLLQPPPLRRRGGRRGRRVRGARRGAEPACGGL